MGRTACTELQCLYKGALYLFTSQCGTLFTRALTVRVDPFLQCVHITGINGQLKWLAGVIPRVTTQILT